MGKETRYWIHVARSSDVQALEKFESFYDAYKHLLQRDTSEFKIPPVMHFIWLGPDIIDQESIENLVGWIEHHPGWAFKFWTDQDVFLSPHSTFEVCNAEKFPFLFLRKLYEESKSFAEKADFLRLEILYQEGGAFIETSSKCLKGFDPLHRGFDFYCGLKAPHPPLSGRNITTDQGLIGARPFHPVIGKAIELMGKKGEDQKRKLVQEATSCILTEALIDRLGEDGNIDIVLPASYFFAQEEMTPLYSKPLFATSWAEEILPTKHVMGDMIEQIRESRTTRWIVRHAISLNLLAFTGIFLYIFKRKRRKS